MLPVDTDCSQWTQSAPSGHRVLPVDMTSPIFIFLYFKMASVRSDLRKEIIYLYSVLKSYKSVQSSIAERSPESFPSLRVSFEITMLVYELSGRIGCQYSVFLKQVRRVIYYSRDKERMAAQSTVSRRRKLTNTIIVFIKVYLSSWTLFSSALRSDIDPICHFPVLGSKIKWLHYGKRHTAPDRQDIQPELVS